MFGVSRWSHLVPSHYSVEDKKGMEALLQVLKSGSGWMLFGSLVQCLCH